MLVALALTVLAQTEPGEAFGGVMAPSTLPPGGSAVYGFIGAPEIGAGYRQGIGVVELEGRLSFDYFAVGFSGDGLLKHRVWQRGGAELAPYVGLGLVWNSGARYLDRANFHYLGIRPRGGVVSTLALAETVRALLNVDAAWDIAFQPPYGYRFEALAGAGAETYLGRDLFGMALARIGVESLKEPPLGVPLWRPAWQLMLGLGLRLF